MTAHTRMTTSLADPVRPGCKCCGREDRHDAIVRLMKGPLNQDRFDGWAALRRIAEEAK